MHGHGPTHYFKKGKNGTSTSWLKTVLDMDQFNELKYSSILEALLIQSLVVVKLFVISSIFPDSH